MSGYTRMDVEQAVNSAADDVLDIIDAPDEGTRDAVNLVVNVALHRLEHGLEASVQDVIAANYSPDDDGAGPIEWAQR